MIGRWPDAVGPRGFRIPDYLTTQSLCAQLWLSNTTSTRCSPIEDPTPRCPPPPAAPTGITASPRGLPCQRQGDQPARSSFRTSAAPADDRWFQVRREPDDSHSPTRPTATSSSSSPQWAAHRPTRSGTPTSLPSRSSPLSSTGETFRARATVATPRSAAGCTPSTPRCTHVRRVRAEDQQGDPGRPAGARRPRTRLIPARAVAGSRSFVGAGPAGPRSVCRRARSVLARDRLQVDGPDLAGATGLSSDERGGHCGAP